MSVQFKGSTLRAVLVEALVNKCRVILVKDQGVYFMAEHGERRPDGRQKRIAYAVGFVTPAERHAGLDAGLLRKRIDVYEAAKKKHPERWSGATRNWLPVGPVHLNPDQHADKKLDQREVTSGLKKAA